MTHCQQLGDEGADDLVDLINRATEDAKEDTIVLAGEKYERRLSEEIGVVNQNIAETRAELERNISETRAELEQRITRVEARLQTQLADTKAELIRWMFIFWAGQLVAMVGILFAFFR